MADLVHSIHKRLKVHDLEGVVIHSIVRDEVQDFSLAELFLDTRSVQVTQLCCTHAYIALSGTINMKFSHMCRLVTELSGLLYFGDPCQTIAPGIVFRFKDVCTMLHKVVQDSKVSFTYICA